MSAGFTPAMGSSRMISSGSHHQRPRHFEQFALAPGQRSGVVRCHMGEPETLQDSAGSLVVRGLDFRQRPNKRSADALAGLIGGSEASGSRARSSRARDRVSWNVRTMPRLAT